MIKSIRRSKSHSRISKAHQYKAKIDAISQKSTKKRIESSQIQLYMASIRKYPLLTRKEEKDLSIRYLEQGDLNAGYRLIISNLRLVVKIALGFQRKWKNNLLDLIQEGNIGLIKSIDKFDPHRGYKFSYYASFWIKAYIIKFIMDSYRLVKIGTTQSQRKLFFNLRKEKEKLRAKGVEASPQVLSARLKVKESVVVEMDQRLSNRDLSLDTPLKEGSGSTHKEALRSDGLPVDERLARREAQAILHHELMEFRDHLEGREAVIFDERLVVDDRMTLQQIANRFGVSRERIRQIESRVKEKLKSHLLEQVNQLDIITETILGA